MTDAGKLLPPADMIEYVGSGTSLDTFEHIGNHFLDHFVRLGGLQPHHRVLDVGCGIGRMALPLTRYLSATGSYDGFDVVAKGVEWCRRKITPRFPHFRFQQADLFNEFYNPAGTKTAREFRFPYPGRSFDFAFMTSVCTHLLPRDLEHYVRELSRVTRPGGRVLLTFFLHSPAVAANVRAGVGSFRLPYRVGKHHLPVGSVPEYGDCNVETEKEPERVVAYEERWAFDLLRGCGFRPDRPVYGEWSGRPGPSFQDIVTATKAGRLSLRQLAKAWLGR
jgi:SAM-dependent methyltransferase